MVGFLLAAAATAWTALAAAIVVESTLDGSDRLVLFGRTVVTVESSTLEVFLCVGIAMSVATLVAAWLVGSLGRRREIQLRYEVDRRWEEISTFNAGMEARKELLEWRLQDLHDQIATLTARRDTLLAEEDRDLAGARDAVRSSRNNDSLRQLRDGVVELPDLDERSERSNVRRFPA